MMIQVSLTVATKAWHLSTTFRCNESNFQGAKTMTSKEEAHTSSVSRTCQGPRIELLWQVVIVKYGIPTIMKKDQRLVTKSHNFRCLLTAGHSSLVLVKLKNLVPSRSGNTQKWSKSLRYRPIQVLSSVCASAIIMTICSLQAKIAV